VNIRSGRDTMKSTYIKLLDNGTYEFGVIEYGADRRRDKLRSHGTRATYADAKIACSQTI
jgi:hypothetical protein